MRSPYQALNLWLAQRYSRQMLYQQNLYQQNLYQQNLYQQNLYQQNLYQQNLYQQNLEQLLTPSGFQSTHPSPNTTCVIIPVYNEAQSLSRTLTAIQDFLQVQEGFSFLFVDDGSIDATPHLLQRFLQQQTSPQISSQLRAVHLQQNQGKGGAVKTGMLLADSKYVCFLDGDLAYSLNYLPQFVQALQTWDVVIGSRNLGQTSQSHVRPLRRLAGKLFNVLSRRIVNLDFPDMQAGIKGFRREVIAQIGPRQKLTGFSFDVELLYLTRKFGHQIGQLPVSVSAHHARKPSTVKLFQDSIKMLLDLLAIRWNDRQGRYD
jgi:dolichyl-phosphate beta-glucosyltransferase